MIKKTDELDAVAAIDQPPVSAEQLASQIFPLINDYFVGETQPDGNAVLYRMPNGQKFKISVQAY